MFKSKAGAILALFIIIAVIIVTTAFHAPWWCYIGEFFIYMAVFSNLIALLLEDRNPYAARTLIKAAYVFSALFFLCIIVLFILSLTLGQK